MARGMMPFTTPKKPPCRSDCEERSAICHTTCEKYLSWKAEHDALMSEVRAQNRLDYALSERERASKRWRKK